MRTVTGLCLLGGALLFGACGDDGGTYLFPPKPECEGDAIVAYQGTQPQVISTLGIGRKEDGFDLDRDGAPDNKLAAIGGIAQGAISDAVNNYDIVIPIEFFSLEAAAPDSCVKFAIYLGAFAKDNDLDGERPYVDGGDCNDHDAAVRPGTTEIVGNFVDDDCDGKADEDGQDVASLDTVDHDGDGASMAQGDCDDRVGMGGGIHPGAAEVCGDGFDNDCNGEADRTEVSGGQPKCSPFDGANPADIPLDPLSFVDGRPAIVFHDGVIVEQELRDGSGTGMVMNAGPSLFGVNVPIANGISLDLRITGATIEAQVVQTGEFITLKNGRLGGVIDAITADTIRGLKVDQIGLLPENSLLDATFANILGALLALPKAAGSVGDRYKDCRTPDVDVDGDGLEAFCDTCFNPSAKQMDSCDKDELGNIIDPKVVDVCVDGDGTEVKDVIGSDGVVVMNCTEAVKGGKARFIDGISVELNFGTTQIKSIKPPT